MIAWIASDPGGKFRLASLSHGIVSAWGWVTATTFLSQEMAKEAGWRVVKVRLEEVE